MDYEDGTHYLCELIKELAGKRNATSYQGDFMISATIGEVEKVGREQIECLLVIQYDSVDINVHWEDSGYKKYKELGLFGKYSSKYQELRQVSDCSFALSDSSGKYVLTFEW